MSCEPQPPLLCRFFSWTSRGAQRFGLADVLAQLAPSYHEKSNLQVQRFRAAMAMAERQWKSMDQHRSAWSKQIFLVVEEVYF